LSSEKSLRTIIVSTERSGTVSCASMVENIFRLSNRRVGQEHLCRVLFDGLCELRETNEVVAC
jgi:hypothetical protein